MGKEVTTNGNGFSGKAQIALGAASILIALGGAFIGAYISPQNQKIAENSEYVRKIADKMAVMEAENISLREKLKEIDTQISWSTDIENIHKRHVLQLLAILWKATFKTELPLPTSLADGPPKATRN